MEQGYMYNGSEAYTRNRLVGADDDEDCDDQSDDGPLLSYKYERYRRHPSYSSEGVGGDRRRSTLGVVLKFTLFCTAMILFCVLMYIPMYNRVIEHIPKDVVAGWTVHTNRDTKIYVQPNNVTIIHEPFNPCFSPEDQNHRLFLLIVVCSATENFERRIAIRETWGNYQYYIKLTKLHNLIKEKYKTYNYTFDLYPEPTIPSPNASIYKVNTTISNNRIKRDVGYHALLPKLAEVLKKSLVTVKVDSVTEEKRFEDDINGAAEFDMNKELETNVLQNYDYDYESHVMRISPKGEAGDSPTLDKILSLLRKSNLKDEGDEKDERDETPKESATDVDFKVVFLLGKPANDSQMQARIDEEVDTYGDIVQENFIDSYNNLTLKSVMMLKWVTNHCNDNNLRYILKTDDDMFINVVNIVSTLRNKSTEFDRKPHKPGQLEYLLIGNLICGAKPVLDASNKWFSPRYMYGGRVYPWYLSGTGYLLSVPAARSLYQAALYTPLFHLEDVYITGICAARAHPRLRPAQAPAFFPRLSTAAAACDAADYAGVHRVVPAGMRALTRFLMDVSNQDLCERKRLTQVRRDRLRPKRPPNKLTKHSRRHASAI